MREYDVKVLRGQGGNVFIFYYGGGKIWVCKNGGRALGIAAQTETDFSVCQGEDGGLYLLYKSTWGELCLCHSMEGEHWEKKTLLSNVHPQTTCFYMIMEKGVLTLFYHVPEESGKGHKFMKLSGTGTQWEEPYPIDTILPTAKFRFLVHPIEENHVALFYKTEQNQFTCREMLLSPTTLGSPKTLISYSYPCQDVSFLTNSTGIHALYALRGVFSTQVLYLNKKGAQPGKPVVIWEGQKCESVLLFEGERKLWAFWFSGGIPLYAVSTDEGQTFSKPARYRQPLPRRYRKGEFLNYDQNLTTNFYSNEILVNGNDMSQVLLAPDFCSHFYQKQSQGRKDITAASINVFPGERTGQRADVLENRIAALEKEVTEKTIQLTEMAKSLGEKSNEVTAISQEWKEKYKKLQDQYAGLEAEKDILAEQRQKFLEENIKLKEQLQSCIEKEMMQKTQQTEPQES